MIILLSDTANLVEPLAEALAEEVLRRGGRVAYLSSAPQEEPMKWFQNSVREYAELHPDIRVEYFDLSSNFPEDRLSDILKYGTIHLSGGNSFEFLKSLKSRSVEDILRKHLSGHGLIVGVSAGAMVLTPSVSLAALAGDKVNQGAPNAQALGVLPFEFFPHFTGTQEQIEQLTRYSRATESALYACRDGGGVVCNGGASRCYGPVSKIQAGSFAAVY